MKNLNNLSMHTSGSNSGVFWTDDAGNRHHVWLVMEQLPGTTYDSPNNGYAPASPFTVRREYVSGKGNVGKQTLYRNPPLKADGTPRNRREEGYFDTRHLDAEAAVNAAVVQEALRRAEAEGMFEQAVKAAKEAKDREEATRRATMAANMREKLQARRERLGDGEDRVAVRLLIDAVLDASDDDLLEFARLS